MKVGVKNLIYKSGQDLFPEIETFVLSVMLSSSAL